MAFQTISLLLASLAAPDPGAQPPASEQAKRFVLRSDTRVYEVGINFAYQTTVWFPVDCTHPAIGDAEFFGVFYDKKRARQRRFIVSALVEKPGATTNVTFECDEGVQLSIVFTQVPVGQAALTVEFAFDENEDARIRAIVAKERKECAERTDISLADARAQYELDLENDLVAGLLERLVFGDEFTATKQHWVNLKSRNALLIGQRGYILFEVLPRRSEPVVVQRVDVLATETDALLPGARLVMPEPKVLGGKVGRGVAVFTNPGDVREFTLVVYLDGGETIELRGVEL